MIDNPQDGLITNKAWRVFKVSYYDAGSYPSGIDKGTFLSTLNKRDISLKFQVEVTGAISSKITLSDAGHRLFARIRDIAGNEIVASSYFIVDMILPFIKVIVFS